MDIKFVIKGNLPGLNEYTAANRISPYKGAKMKKDSENIVRWAIRDIKIRIEKPVTIRFRWYEKNRRRDHDNVSSFGRKVIQDALVKAGILKDDGWDEILGFSDEFYLDRKNPRIEVIIEQG